MPFTFSLLTETRVSPVQNAIQDNADDDDSAIQAGNGALKGMRRKVQENVRLPHSLGYSAKVNLRDVYAWDLCLGERVKRYVQDYTTPVYLGRPDATLRG